MKKAVVGAVVVSLLSLAICVYLFVSGSSGRQIVYADAIRLFDSYQYKTDMERASQPKLAGLKAELDSVGVIYKANPSDAQAQQMVLFKEQQLRAGYEEVNKEINQKVWERLNPLIQSFGKEKNIEMLIGANGMGTLLYGSDRKDVTDELIMYVNKSYEGNH